MNFKQGYKMIDFKSEKLVYDQVMEFCKVKNIKMKDFYSSIGMSDVGFRMTWRQKNPKSVKTLVDILNFIEHNSNK
jgi:hypothetical protein